MNNIHFLVGHRQSQAQSHIHSVIHSSPAHLEVSWLVTVTVVKIKN